MIESPAQALAPAGLAARGYRAALFPLLGLALVLALCAAVVLLSGQQPMVAARALLDGALGSSARRSESLAKTIPLVMTGLSVVVAFRVGFWNIGCEGQFLAGGLAAAAIGTRTGLSYPFVLAGGTLAGALWAYFPGWLKVRREAPEIITTIMLNYIALYLISFLVQGPLQERVRSQPESDVLSPAAQLPLLVPNTTLHAGLYVALGAAVLCWWLLYRTEWGFTLRAVGENAVAAKVARIDANKMTLRAVALSGALSGLGGAMEIAGATRQLGLDGFGYGYTAIAVGLLANLNPLAVVPAAFLFGCLSAGGGAMERSANVPAVTVSVLTGLLIFYVAALPRLKKN